MAMRDKAVGVSLALLLGVLGAQAQSSYFVFFAPDPGNPNLPPGPVQMGYVGWDNNAKIVKLIAQPDPVSAQGGHIRIQAASNTTPGCVYVTAGNGPAAGGAIVLMPGKANDPLANGAVEVGSTDERRDLVIHGKIRIDDWTFAQKTPDFVFDSTYHLRPLAEVDTFVARRKHLPGVPSGKQLSRDGLDLVEMNLTLLKKVEELTLYAIAQEKRLNTQAAQIDSLKKAVAR